MHLQDFAKITYLEGARPNIYMKLLIDTRNLGSYDISILGDPYKDHNMEITRRHNMNMTDATNFLMFVRGAIDNYPAEKIMLVMGGHGGGWYLSMEEGCN